MKSAFLSASMLAGLCGFVMPAQAVYIGAGTAEYVTARDCSTAGTSGCDEMSGVIFGQYGGLPGDMTSSASQTFAGYGAASGSVSLSGIIGAPILKASATSEPGKRVNTNSVALQRYVYEGDTPTTRTFAGTITYSQSVLGTYPDTVGGGISAALEVFTLPTSTISVGSSARANFNMLFGGYASLDGYVSLGSSLYADHDSTTSGSGSLSVTVELNPGDAIWVWALVQTPATNGGWVDSSHTFITAWDQPASLVPTVVAVPEPESWWLWGVGSAFLVVAAHRRSQKVSVGV